MSFTLRYSSNSARVGEVEQPLRYFQIDFMGQSGFLFSQTNKESTHTHMQLTTFKRLQITDKDVLPWCVSSEKRLFAYCSNGTRKNNMGYVGMRAGVGSLALPLQLALISDNSLFLMILLRKQPWQMHFEIWGMWWFPREGGLHI